MKEWPIKTMKMMDLHINPDNPRTISESSMEALRNSIGRFGFVEPIIWNERTGNIVGGHQRYRVLVEQGVEETEVIVLDMPEEEELALNVTLNNDAIQGEFTDNATDLLNQVSNNLGDSFSELRLDDLLTSLEDVEVSSNESEEEEAIENGMADESMEEAIVVAQEGDLWKLGDHKLYCGSATDKKSWDVLFGTKKMALWYDLPLQPIMEPIWRDVLEVGKNYGNSCYVGRFSFVLLDKLVELMDEVGWEVKGQILLLVDGRGKGDFLRGYDSILYSGEDEVKKVWEEGLVTNITDPDLGIIFGNEKVFMECEKGDKICYMMMSELKSVDRVIEKWQKATQKMAMLGNEKFDEVKESRQ